MWDKVSIVEKPADLPVSLADLKGWLAIGHSDDDAMLTMILQAAVGQIDGPGAYGLAIMAQTWRLTLDRFPCAILLPGWPVTSIVAVRYIDPAGVQRTLAAEGYLTDLDIEPVGITPAFGKIWPSARTQQGAVKIDYRLGAAVANDVDPVLKRAVLMLAAHAYAHREEASEGALQSVPFGVADTLNAYRRGFAG